MTSTRVSKAGWGKPGKLTIDGIGRRGGAARNIAVGGAAMNASRTATSEWSLGSIRCGRAPTHMRGRLNIM